MHRTPLLTLLCVFALVISSAAQTPSNKKDSPAKPTKTKPAKFDSTKAKEEDAVAAQNRIVTVTLLTALAEDAHSFRDQRLRSRVQARAADALWEGDEDKARALFRRAWDDAGVADADAARVQAEQMRKARAEGGPVFLRGRPEMRNEVLRLVAKRDSKLGEEFLKSLEEAVERDANDAEAELRRSGNSAPASASKRLQLARRLLEDGDLKTLI